MKLAMKLGKATATAVGGGILLLQIAKYNGYINVSCLKQFKKALYYTN